jgi:3-dehydroquinate synthase
MQELTLVVPGQSASTRIVVGAGALDVLGEVAADAPRIALVTDVNVDSAGWARRATAALEARPGRVAHVCRLPPGEGAKTAASVEALWAAWSAAELGRDGLVVAVGGGVVTDVAGFAAATHLRGVSWVAVPTTLLAMADAAIGGKTGVNTPSGKNLAGAVHHPRAVLADLATLRTLPDATRAEGWAEVVKAAVIGDADLFEALESAAVALRGRDESAAAGVLSRSIRVKAAVVKSDAREASRREILNFGHTVAHALEHASAGRLSHGRAVACGLVAESRLAVDLGRLPAEAPARIAALVHDLGLVRPRAVELPERSAVEASLLADKKRRRGTLRVALPSGWGAHVAAPGLEVDASRLLDAVWSD